MSILNSSFRRSLSLFLFSAVLVNSAFALPRSEMGGTSSGGGDQCKNEIDKHRIEIQNWILRNDASGLDFSKAQVNGWTYNDPSPAKSYKRSMLDVLQPGKVVVTCYLDPARISDPAAQKIAATEGVTYKAITIGNPPESTTCINYEDASGVSHIDCNYDLIMDSNSLGDPDYKTTHHEFASIAGVEARTNTYTSDMSVSNQLSEFEHLETIMVLGPRITITPTPTPTCKTHICVGDLVNAYVPEPSGPFGIGVEHITEVGTVLEIFPNGTASINFGDDIGVNIFNTKDLGKGVNCFVNICTGMRVESGNAPGTIKAVFDNGFVSVLYDHNSYNDIATFANLGLLTPKISLELWAVKQRVKLGN